MNYIIILFLLSIITFAYYRYAIKTNILDNPSARSSHTTPTVRGGGIVFFLAVLLFFIWQLKVDYPYFLSGFLLLSIIGFIDDKKNLSPKARFPFQLLAIALILYQAGLFNHELPIYLQITGFIVAVGFVNAFNFMDGINGITGFYTTAIIIPLYFINRQYQLLQNEWFYVMLISIAVFGYFNFRKKALMFAGDIGSMALAALLLFWLSKTMIDTKSPLLLVFVAVYGIDSAWTIIYRLKNHENIFEAHRWHLYQKFVDIWQWSHLKVAGLYAGVQLLISFAVLNLIEKPISIQLSIVIGIYLIFSVIYFIAQKYFKTQTKV